MTVIRAGGHDVLVGNVAAGFDRIRDLGAGGTPVLVSEPRVFALHGHAIAEAFGADPVLVPEGEAAKQWDVLHRLLGQFSDRNVGRSTPVLALGGGSVGDVAGLAASLFKRGCPIVHIPTTLLAQADSAIGGKTAIDAFGQKNLVGSFHQPALVLVDPQLLDTLDERQLRSGYAEVVKYGLVDDPGFFAWCEANGRGILAGHRDLREQAVVMSIRAKARIVAEDIEDRTGRRALLNLGHSFAHAIESEAGFGQFLHGEAVALGISLAFRLSTELGLCPAGDTRRVIDHFAAVGLPTTLSAVGVSGEKLAGWMERDKKNVGGQLALVLSRGIGHAFVDRSVGPARLGAFLARAD